MCRSHTDLSLARACTLPTWCPRAPTTASRRATAAPASWSAAPRPRSSHPHALQLLSEVALGDMYELKQSKYVEKLPAGKLATKGLGGTAPDPAGNVTLPVHAMHRLHSVHRASGWCCCAGGQGRGHWRGLKPAVQRVFGGACGSGVADGAQSLCTTRRRSTSSTCCACRSSTSSSHVLWLSLLHAMQSIHQSIYSAASVGCSLSTSSRGATLLIDREPWQGVTCNPLMQSTTHQRVHVAVGVLLGQVHDADDGLEVDAVLGKALPAAVEHDKHLSWARVRPAETVALVDL